MNKQLKTIMKVSSELMPLATFVGKENGKTFPFDGRPGIHPNITAAIWGAECIGYQFLPININTYKGGIPSGAELVMTAGGNINEAYILHGFDEVGEFDSMVKNPVYGFTPTLSKPLSIDGIEFEENHEVYAAYVKNKMSKIPTGPIAIPTKH
jgi:hypothetical protein